MQSKGLITPQRTWQLLLRGRAELSPPGTAAACPQEWGPSWVVSSCHAWWPRSFCGAAEYATRVNAAVELLDGVVAPQVTQARERRSARATAAERLGGVEMVRWWPATYSGYRERLILFRAAAVGANLPKAVLDEYVRLSRVARLASFSAHLRQQRRRQTVALQLRDDPNVQWSLIYRGWQDPADATQDNTSGTPRHPSTP